MRPNTEESIIKPGAGNTRSAGHQEERSSVAEGHVCTKTAAILIGRSTKISVWLTVIASVVLVVKESDALFPQ